MLSDHERRTLDATAALLAQDDPDLADRLTHRPPVPPTPARTSRSAAWPPLIMFVFCLMMLLPGLMIGAREHRPAESGGPSAESTQMARTTPSGARTAARDVVPSPAPRAWAP